jgi:hypothetical protein
MLIKHKLFYHISVLFNCKKIIPMWIPKAPCRFHRIHYCILHKDPLYCIFTQPIINDNFSPCPILQLFHIYNSQNPSGSTMALEATQSLTEMSTRNISGGQRRPVRTANNLTTFLCRLSRYLAASSSWNPMGV